MEQEHAVEVLIKAVQLATRRGAFELSETEIILQATKVFTQNVENLTDTPKEVENTGKENK